MKNSIILFLKLLVTVFLLQALLMACEDDQDPGKDIPGSGSGEVKGVVRPVGTPVGELFTQEVGPEGGEVKTPEGSVTVNIPAGALTETVTIGVQEVENTNHAGVGKSFRLTPHGQQFLKEVEISISYEGQEDKIPSTYALGVSYQDDKGIWNFVAAPEVDEANKLVKVKSTHFSDWVAMLWMHILPLEATIEAGGSVELKAVRFIPVGEDENDLLAPLVPPAGWVPVGEHVALEEEYIGKWSLAGAGVLESGGSTATYSAPNIAPTVNPVAVSLQLSSQEEQIILVSNITVLGGGIEFRINGGEWITMEGAAVMLEDNNYGISSVTNGGQFTLLWSGGKGLHPYTNDREYDNSFQYWPSGPTLAYTSFYETDMDYNINSGGGINITSMGDEDGWVTGTFTVIPSGMYHVNEDKMVGTATVEGRFRVRRGWGFF